MKTENLQLFDLEVAQREREIDASLKYFGRTKIAALNRVESEPGVREKLKEQGLSEEQITLVIDVSVKPDEIEQIYSEIIEQLLCEQELICKYRRTFNVQDLPQSC
ncbi:hypothetical protein [Limnohabitans sp.]|uniref:hypothetical protein n=1 Tax=Limnohabitans sp. TaxID=1907725 RepID=UPI00286F40EC|nr:hypothetical protein [Limnohabitans sp.]